MGRLNKRQLSRCNRDTIKVYIIYIYNMYLLYNYIIVSYIIYKTSDKCVYLEI